ncbi:MAG TPA: hypothetical protein VMV69_23195 [Pirellulales bacterium]|nr:hypothetical protein [Pirellulales bacterium]
MIMTTDVLRTELETYGQRKQELLESSEGKFVVIHRANVAGVWDTYEGALHAGYEKFGLVPFLVKQIERIERVEFIGLVAQCPR